MRLDKSLYYGISRVDQDEKSNHGWNVRITWRSKVHCKWFPDGPTGNRYFSFEKAKTYRNELLEALKSKGFVPPRRRENIPQCCVTGVTHVSQTVGDKIYYSWKAQWKDQFGKIRTKKFSIEKHGDKKAQSLAIAHVTRSRVENATKGKRK